MTIEQWYEEHGYEPDERSRTLIGWCSGCKEPVFSDEAALEGEIFQGGKNPPQRVLLHAECFREWVNEHVDDEELAKALDFIKAGEAPDDGY